MTTTTADATEIVGHALYIEAARTASTEKHVIQLLITPELKFNTGSEITTTPLSMYRRRISSSHPRATWKNFGSSVSSDKLLDKHRILVTSARSEATVNDMLSPIMSTMQALKTNYTLVGAPITVEISRADVADIRLRKTPYKVFGRVWKSRKKLGFPTEFV